MEDMDIKVFDAFGKTEVNGIHKSAIIYRDDSARFIYVCFHCGSMFNEIGDTLQHIESHFQLVNVQLVDQLTVDGNELQDNLGLSSAQDNLDIKMEAVNYFDESPPALAALTVIKEVDKQTSKFNIEKDTMKEKLKKAVQHEESIAVNSNPIVLADIPIISEVEDTTKDKQKKVTGVSSRKKERLRKRPYRCHICSKSWINMTNLRSHLNRHTNAALLRINKCKECDEYFKSVCALRIHVLKVHLKEATFRCNECSTQFTASQSQEFEEHLQKHSGRGKKSWTNTTDCIKHCKSDYTKYEEFDSFPGERHSCEFCTQKFYIKSNLDVHLGAIHPRRLQCSSCYSIFTSPRHYYAHQLEHKRVGLNIGEIDENTMLANLEALVDERIINHRNELNEQTFSCLICNSTSDTHHEIRTHIRKIHVYPMFPSPMEPKKEFICDFCGVKVKSKHAITQHLMIHTNTKQHACTFCGKMFRLASTTRIHERQHTGEKPYQCHECGKTFRSKSFLTTHKKTHEDITYPCHICGKIFRRQSNHWNHVKTHTEERNFKCTICSKTFNTRLYLRRHMDIHSERKHQCHFCDSKFNTGDGRRQHQRHKHKYEMSLPM